MRRSEANKYRKHLDMVTELLTDEIALEVPDLFRPWVSGKLYVIDDRVRHKDILYKCLQKHTALDNWTPDITPSLWVRISIDEWPEWIQPLGSVDAYDLGAKVSHNNKHWISTIPANVYEPGVYGWNEVNT